MSGSHPPVSCGAWTWRSEAEVLLLSYLDTSTLTPGHWSTQTNVGLFFPVSPVLSPNHRRQVRSLLLSVPGSFGYCRWFTDSVESRPCLADRGSPGTGGREAEGGRYYLSQAWRHSCRTREDSVWSTKSRPWCRKGHRVESCHRPREEALTRTLPNRPCIVLLFGIVI